MRNLSTLITVLFLITTSPFIFAMGDESIYQTDVPVASQSEKDRNPAEQTALEQVLIKVSGNSHLVEKNPKIKASLAHAGDMVQEFTYASSPEPTKSLPYLLTVRFDPDTIKRLLHDAGSSVWEENRPVILVWMANESPGNPSDIVASSDDSIPPAFDETAEQRGIPFIFPMMDVTELAQVSVSDVIGKNIPALQQAAQRYASNGILVGHVTRTRTGVSSQWQLIVAPDQWSWNIDGKNLHEIFVSVVNNVADALAARYSAAPASTAQTQISLSVIGVKDQTDVSQLLQYLQRLTPVADVQLRSVNGSQIILDISLRGSKESFIQSVAIGRNLLPLSGGNAQDQSLKYEWNP